MLALEKNAIIKAAALEKMEPLLGIDIPYSEAAILLIKCLDLVSEPNLTDPELETLEKQADQLAKTWKEMNQNKTSGSSLSK